MKKKSSRETYNIDPVGVLAVRGVCGVFADVVRFDVDFGVDGGLKMSGI